MKLVVRDANHRPIDAGGDHWHVQLEGRGVRVSVSESPAEAYLSISIDPLNEGWITRLDVRDIAVGTGQARLSVRGRREDERGVLQTAIESVENLRSQFLSGKPNRPVTPDDIEQALAELAMALRGIKVMAS